MTPTNNHWQFHWRQGLSYHQNNQLDLAIEAYQLVLQEQPELADVHANLAMALAYNQQYQAAHQAFHRALALQPDHALNHNNYGYFLSQLGSWQSAEHHLRRAAQLDPRLGVVWFNLGNVLRSLDRWPEAAACYERAWPLESTRLDILSDWLFALKKLCRWSAQEVIALGLLQASARQLQIQRPSPINPFLACLLPLSLAQFQQICVSQARTLSARVHQNAHYPRFSHQPKPENGQRLKVGYLCAAFGRHPTGHLMAGMFSQHDRTRFEIYGYATSPDDGSSYRQQIGASIEHFQEVHDRSDPAIAELIHTDGIDVLIDLDGYTTHHSQTVFALKPAPVQVTWLGFPGTTGADYMDYLIADPIVVPPDFDRFYTEAIVRLPLYQVNNHRQFPPFPVLHRHTANLPPTALVLCSFNNNTKIDYPTFQAWLRILKAVPSAVLWILVDTAEALENLRLGAEEAGIAPERIIPAERREEPLAHITRLPLADLYLDCFTYNAHTTASDALWAGVPVLTCKGETFASRVGASLVTAAGLPQLVCESPQQFEAEAIRLAHNRQELQAYRQHLQSQKYQLPLFDTKAFVRSLEAAIEKMSQRFQRSKAIQSIDIR